MTAATEFGLGAYMIFSVVVWLVGIICLWKIFDKAGEAGWKALIPVYRYYMLFKISWTGLMYLLILLLSFAAVALSNLYTTSNTIMLIIVAVLLLAAILIHIIQAVKLSKSFGYGAGFAVGLVFLPFIFYLILGFGSSQYTQQE